LVLEELRFSESQKFRSWWMILIYVLLLGSFALVVYGDIRQIFLEKPFGNKPAPDIVLIIMTLAIVLVFILLYRAELETIITKDGVSYRWNPFRKKFTLISWSSVDQVEIINYGFIGYGWRLTSFGVVYNVAGKEGLHLILKSGRKITLGTQKPRELANFLKSIKVMN